MLSPMAAAMPSGNQGNQGNYMMLQQRNSPVNSNKMWQVPKGAPLYQKNAGTPQASLQNTSYNPPGPNYQNFS